MVKVAELPAQMVALFTVKTGVEQVVQLGTDASVVIVYEFPALSCTDKGTVPEVVYDVPVPTCCQLGAVEQEVTGVKLLFKQVLLNHIFPVAHAVHCACVVIGVDPPGL